MRRTHTSHSLSQTLPLFPCRHDGPEGFPDRSADHEKVEASEADSVVRCVHVRGAHLHHHRTDEERQPLGIHSGMRVSKK